MKTFTLFLCVVQLSVTFANDAHFLSDAFIEEINSKQDLWKAGRNFDPNTPLSEIKKRMGTFMEGRDKTPRFFKTFDPMWPDGKKIPKRFDSRKKWRKICPRIGEILDQGACGSCWAISAAQAFTDRYCIATKGKHQMRLSTANVLSCCRDCGDGCDGGWEYRAWKYFYTDGLPSGGNWNTSEGCQPYNIQSPCNHYDGSPYQKCPSYEETPACESHCTNSEYSTELSKDLRFGKQRFNLPNDEESIMKEIMTHGPITVAFEVHMDFLYYKSGVYEPRPDSLPVGGHAVKLIGWGVEKDVPYWLVMNSWNEYWGDHGLVKMKRKSPRIELEKEAWAAESDPKRLGCMEAKEIEHVDEEEKAMIGAAPAEQEYEELEE